MNISKEEGKLNDFERLMYAAVKHGLVQIILNDPYFLQSKMIHIFLILSIFFDFFGRKAYIC